ncbi:MAG: hypothetical protein R3E01_15610 [Pirellulaceae bacterium]|nr:hypothetical protein [Planctomycetales bacterium]
MNKLRWQRIVLLVLLGSAAGLVYSAHRNRTSRLSQTIAIAEECRLALTTAATAEQPAIELWNTILQQLHDGDLQLPPDDRVDIAVTIFAATHNRLDHNTSRENTSSENTNRGHFATCRIIGQGLDREVVEQRMKTVIDAVDDAVRKKGSILSHGLHSQADVALAVPISATSPPPAHVGVKSSTVPANNTLVAALSSVKTIARVAGSRVKSANKGRGASPRSAAGTTADTSSTQLKALSAKIEAIQQRIAAAEAAVQQLQAFADGGDFIGVDPSILQLIDAGQRQQLTSIGKLQQDLAQLRKKMNDEHPTIQAMLLDLAEHRVAVQGSMSDIIQQVRNLIVADQQESQTLGNAQRALQEKLAQSNSASQEPNASRTIRANNVSVTSALNALGAFPAVVGKLRRTRTSSGSDVEIAKATETETVTTSGNVPTSLAAAPSFSPSTILDVLETEWTDQPWGAPQARDAGYGALAGLLLGVIMAVTTRPTSPRQGGLTAAQQTRPTSGEQHGRDSAGRRAVDKDPSSQQTAASPGSQSPVNVEQNMEELTDLLADLAERGEADRGVTGNRKTNDLDNGNARDLPSS